MQKNDINKLYDKMKTSEYNWQGITQDDMHILIIKLKISGMIDG